MAWSMALVIKADIDLTPRTLSTSAEASLFNLVLLTCFFQSLLLDLLCYCWATRMTNQPSANRLFYLDHHLHHMGNYSAGHVWGMGSKSTEKHEITEMHFFLASFRSCICKLPLCLLHFICAWCFTHRYGSHTLTATGSFLFLPFSPLPCLLCPSKFPWDFILAISNRIGTQFVMLHVTFLANSAVNIETS